MDILYIMVVVSLSLSIGFLVLFFWAVDHHQMSSLDAVAWNALEEAEVVNQDGIQSLDKSKK